MNEVTTPQIKFPFASIRPVRIKLQYGGHRWVAASGCRYYGPEHTSREACLGWIYS